MQGEHQRTLQALAPAVAARPDASMTQLMEMFGPPRLRLENAGNDRPAVVLRTSPRHSTEGTDRITQLSSSPEAVRQTTVEDIEDAEEANE